MDKDDKYDQDTKSITISNNGTKKDFTCLFTSSIGNQFSTEELMNTMPLRETVAGDALSILCGSKTTLQLGAMGIRSPLARVSVLLSSNTELRFSIQIASTGPSRTIQICSPERENSMLRCLNTICCMTYAFLLLLE